MNIITQKNDDEQGWSKIRKAATTAIRLKYALMADDELNEVLPHLQEQYQKALESRKPYELDMGWLMEKLDDEEQSS